MTSRIFLIQVFSGIAIAAGMTLAWLIVNWFVSISLIPLLITVFVAESVFFTSQWFLAGQKKPAQ